MNFDRINEQLHKIKTTKKIEDIHTLIGFLVESFGITQSNPEELFMHASVQREVSRFMPAQGFRNQAAAYTIPHQSGIPLDIKLFWMKKTTKANLSWIMALTPNYEDNPETNANLNIGIDIVVSENCDSVFIVLSNNLKARVLELNGLLSLTQREIFDNWVKIGRTINRESEHFKKEFHTLLWKSFDFEPINRKFYLQLVEQFDHLVGHLKKNIDEEPAKMFAVRLIGRTLFLWFLRKKEFVNPEFDYFTVSGDADQTEYYREKLEPLFFEVLNTEIKERSFADKITPFLNGGLFEPIDTDFYKDSKLTFPTGFFTQIFNVLNHYNFTVDEGTSEYEQVAVDPEMLGRVFENLLASLNDETGNQARKSKGAFYTPREIVDYMCEQSLVEYLKTKLPETANRDRRIEELVTMDEASFREQDHNKRRDWKKDLGQEQVVQALDELKILDPAVGSGAFPMGMLNLLVKVYTRIDTAREKDLAQLKRDILSRSLYGVDIDQMAIQISRLRAWLSILVDMENLKKAEPLPNLDFKFVCANTLIPLAGLDATNLFDETDLKQDLIKIRDAYYSENRKSFKKKLRDQYLERIKDGGLFAELESERQRQLKDYNPFNPLNSSSFYDPTLMHGVNTFDLVIGNPPYISALAAAKTIPKKIRDKYKDVYISASGTYDIYLLFFEKGLNVLSSDGLLAFITPTKYLSANYAKDFREKVGMSKVYSFFDFSSSRVFASAGVSAFVSLYKNKIDFEKPVMTRIFESSSNLKKYNFILNNRHSLNIFPEMLWGHLIKGHFDILNKIYSQSEVFEVKFGVNGSSTAAEGDEYANYINVDSTGHKIINTGTIDRYVHLWGKKEYSNKKEKVLQPFVDLEKVNLRRKELYLKPKLIFPKLSKRLMCVLDMNGEFASTNTTFLYDTDDAEELVFLAGLINSKTYDFIYRCIFSGLNLLGSFQFQAPQIRLLPFPKEVNIPLKNGIIKIVESIIQKKQNDLNSNTVDLESQVDELVMNLYGLNKEEKEIIRNS